MNNSNLKEMIKAATDDASGVTEKCAEVKVMQEKQH